MSPPELLIDPDGEGIYLLAESSRPAVAPLLMQAARELGLDSWREVRTEYVYLRPREGNPDDAWYPASIGRWPRGWRLNLPRRWRPALFAYCTPQPS